MAGEQKEVKTILLTGPITLYEVSAVRESLSTALAEGKSLLQIDLSDSGPWDLAGLQLIVSCVRTARNHEWEARLINVPKPCVDIAERSGLAEWLRSVQD
jgi:ABC-type transporter Mla MlaB component